MRRLFIGFFVVLSAACAVTQTVPPGPPSVPPLRCRKNISFAIAEGGQPVPAIPKWAGKWIGKAKHVDGYPQLCLSQIPSSSTMNYLVLFSIRESSFDGLKPSAHTYTSTDPSSGDATRVSSYGGTWTYSYSGSPPSAATSSLDLQRVDSSKNVLVIRAYDQEGRQVSHYAVNQDNPREKLLQMAINDIYRQPADMPLQKRVAAPLSVYYVNCDVDSPNPVSPAPRIAVEGPASPKPAPTPPPQSVIELVSNPPGAGVYLDGSYVGSTPFTVTVAPGEHLVIMQKQEYSTWQKKFRASVGTLRLTGYLERRVVVLP